MKIVTRFFFVVLLFAAILACSRPPEFPKEPVIEYIGLSNNRIVQSRAATIPLDTIEIMFSFTDGDGDLGSADSINVILTDSRDGFEHVFKVSEIPKLGSGSGIQGKIAIRLTNSVDTRYFCCTFPNTNLTCIPSATYPTDTMTYAIRIRDRTGNWSNTVRTELITILCQ